MYEGMFYDLYRAEDDERRYEEKCPVCCVCGEHITDEYFFQIGGEYFHEGCVDRVHTETWVENNGGY